jgi:hypothetical protein
VSIKSSQYANLEKFRARRRAYMKKRRQMLRQVTKDVKNRPCADCGQHLESRQMCFHHLSDKEFNVSQGAFSKSKVYVEIAKCVVLCHPCHIRRHIKFDVQGRLYCPKCATYKPTSEFTPNRRSLRGFRGECRLCSTERYREYKRRKRGAAA